MSYALYSTIPRFIWQQPPGFFPSFSGILKTDRLFWRNYGKNQRMRRCFLHRRFWLRRFGNFMERLHSLVDGAHRRSLLFIFASVTAGRTLPFHHQKMYSGKRLHYDGRIFRRNLGKPHLSLAGMGLFPSIRKSFRTDLPLVLLSVAFDLRRRLPSLRPAPTVFLSKTAIRRTGTVPILFAKEIGKHLLRLV